MPNPAKPLELRKAQGNPGKRKMPTPPPAPERAVEAPQWMSKRARVHWDRLLPLVTSMRVMTAGDEDGLAMGCQALVEYLTASRKMDRLGQTYTIDGPSGEIIRKRPECEIAADAWRRYMTALGQFGLTPSARMKVSQAGGGKQVRDEWDEF